MTGAQTFIDEANKWLWVRSSDDRGLAQINSFLNDMGLSSGYPWCAAFVQHCLRVAEVSQIYRSASCMEIWNKTDESLRIRKPEPGCLIVWQHENSAAGHIGIVVDVVNDTTLQTIEGNTTPASTIDRSGDGVYLKRRHSHIVAGPMKLLGFLKSDI